MSTGVPQVLIPIDFSEQSLIALDQSHNLAKFYHAELTLIYVRHTAGFFESMFSKKSAGQNLSDAEVKSRLEALAAAKKEKIGINTNIVITKGDISEEILKTADAIGAKLIIMGTSGTAKDIAKKIVGTHAFKIVREAKCPVITIKGKSHRNGCKNILLPIDLTNESREKVNTAITLGKLYGATIHVITILYTHDKDAAFRLKKQVEHVKKFILAAGVECTSQLITIVKGHQKVVDAILDYGNKIEADLLMIMTQQEGEMKPFFVGSTAQDLINQSDIPIMSIVPSVKNESSFSPY